jgi:hypothetical protein
MKMKPSDEDVPLRKLGQHLLYENSARALRQIFEQMRVGAGVRNHALLSIVLENEMVILGQMLEPQTFLPLRNNYIRLGNRECIDSAIAFPQNQRTEPAGHIVCMTQ